MKSGTEKISENENQNVVWKKPKKNKPKHILNISKCNDIPKKQLVTKTKPQSKNHKKSIYFNQSTLI